MFNLLQIFLRYGGFLLFLILEGFSFYLVVNFNEKQGKIWFTSSSSWVGGAVNRYDKAIDYFYLKDHIEALQNENAQLRASLGNAYFDNVLEMDSVRNDTTLQQYTFIGANIINKTLIGTKNTMTLNRGKEHGVEPHMGVISPNGIVGIIRGVSDKFSLVMTIFHQDAKFDAVIKRNLYYGSLVWKDPDPRYMYLEAIPKHVDVKVKDTVQTNGYSNIFPAGINIGEIEKITLEPGNNNYTIKVRLFEDLRPLQYVYIVKNLLKEDLEQLEVEE